MSIIVEKKRRWSHDERQRALTALVFHHGDCPATARTLAAEGLKVPLRTIYFWKTEKYTAQYEELERELSEEVKATEIARRKAQAQLQGEAARKLTEELMAESDKIPARDKPGAIRNVETAAAINIDKAQLLAGEPTEIRQQKSVSELLRAFNSKGVEVIDAEVVEDKQLEDGS